MRTERAGHATTLARDHALSGGTYDAVFTLGGDGTAMEVITALAELGPPVGVLPGGTGNVLVRALGIPLRVGRAVAQLTSGVEARIDLGRVSDGRHFAIGLGVGIDEQMIAGASPLMKRRLGYLAYVWSAAKATLRPHTFRARLTVDGQLIERDAALVMLANLGAVRMLGGVLKLGDGILEDDGLLHACIFSPRNFAESFRIFTGFLRGTVASDPRTFYVTGRAFRLETDPPMRAQADGELLMITPIDVTVRPLAARLLIPRSSGPRTT